MDEDAAQVEMSLMGEPKIDDSKRLVLMTLANMKAANLSEYEPQVCSCLRFAFCLSPCPDTV